MHGQGPKHDCSREPNVTAVAGERLRSALDQPFTIISTTRLRIAINTICLPQLTVACLRQCEGIQAESGFLLSRLTRAGTKNEKAHSQNRHQSSSTAIYRQDKEHTEECLHQRKRSIRRSGGSTKEIRSRKPNFSTKSGGARIVRQISAVGAQSRWISGKQCCFSAARGEDLIGQRALVRHRMTLTQFSHWRDKLVSRGMKPARQEGPATSACTAWR